jgi:surface protein
MFYNGGAEYAFNQDLSSWDTSNVTDMSFIFYNEGGGIHTFNQDLSSWDTSNVTDMSFMFYNEGGTHAFDQSLGAWDISSVTNMTDMLYNCGMSPENYSATLSGWGNKGADNIPNNITLGATELTYCGNIGTLLARNTFLIGENGWVIQDAGVDPNCP